ncbi:gonadoliberin III [Marinobacter halodurans]|uniref:Gonadoliberin III n=1 Tax=Marinobacter halodurans TaxID=2528979 RepID=A0ABY1ZV11_9GAMM|nr:inactive transglutaminase family protein [Marinobacter halodurans]TBW59498.1 gonadoliberin III [Marinobacter halodurans]
MKSRYPFYIAIALLIFTGVGIATLRHFELGIPWLSGEERPVWLVEARVDFRANGDPVLVSLNLPDDPPGFHVLSEQAASPGYGFSIVNDKGDRRGEWSIRQANGPQTLYYKAQFIPDPDVQPHPPEQPPEPDTVYWEEPQATAAHEVLALAAEKSSTPESMTRELIKLIRSSDPNQNTALLLAGNDDVDVLVKLLNYADIPARVSEGIMLEDARRRQPLRPFLEIFDGDHWLTFNPQTGEQGLPENVLLWSRNTTSLLDVMGGNQSVVSFAMLRQTVPALQLARAESMKNGLGFLSLYQLPIEEQSMFRMLLLLPLGAMVVVFMRVIVGIRTSGTFMPVLIAVAFLQTSLGPGLVTFITVVALGLLLRGYLSNLNLLLVSRIATLIILVIFMSTAISIVGYQMGFNTGMTVTFFPMVILAWTIERMSILWEEEGPHEVFVQGGGSLLVAVLAYLAMSLPIAGHLTFNFPELHLIILAVILLMGQYTGYKLSELRRFHPMQEYD